MPALNWIAFNLNLDENLAGITFVALGNGAPDIFGAMAAFTSATSETSSLAIGALLGEGLMVDITVCMYKFCIRRRRIHPISRCRCLYMDNTNNGTA